MQLLLAAKVNGKLNQIFKSKLLDFSQITFRHTERHSLLGHEATTTKTLLEDYKFYPFTMLVDQNYCK